MSVVLSAVLVMNSVPHTGGNGVSSVPDYSGASSGGTGAVAGCGVHGDTVDGELRETGQTKSTHTSCSLRTLVVLIHALERLQRLANVDGKGKVGD